MAPRSPKTVTLTLRIPADLRGALRKAAKNDHRSVNSFVIALLSKTFRGVSP